MAARRIAGRPRVASKRPLQEKRCPCICCTKTTDIRTVPELQHRRDVSTTMIPANQQTSGLNAGKQAFESEFSEWITAQNAWVETHGSLAKTFVRGEPHGLVQRLPQPQHGMPYVVVAQSDLLETLPTRSLRKALANVSAQAVALIAAMDVVLSGV